MKDLVFFTNSGGWLGLAYIHMTMVNLAILVDEVDHKCIGKVKNWFCNPLGSPPSCQRLNADCRTRTIQLRQSSLWPLQTPHVRSVAWPSRHCGDGSAQACNETNQPVVRWFVVPQLLKFRGFQIAFQEMTLAWARQVTKGMSAIYDGSRPTALVYGWLDP